MLIYACLFITLLASGRNKPVHLELLSFSWNSAETQKCMLKCPMCFLKVYSSISPNSSGVSSLWQTFKPDTELCRACLREASISSSRLQLFDLVSEETGKKEGEKWKTSDMVLYSNFHKLVCFSAGPLISPAETKSYTSPTAFSESLTTARE